MGMGRWVRMVSGDHATLLGLQSAPHLNGKMVIVLSALKSNGRREVVLTNDLSTGGQLNKYCLKWRAKGFSSVPDGKKKSTNEGNLRRSTTHFYPTIGIPIIDSVER
jgi:hypothetical protein